MRRATALLALLVLLPLAGCAAPPSSGVPSTTPTATPAAAPSNATEIPVYSFERTFHGSSETVEQTFTVDRAGWLCIHAFLRPSSGAAALTIIDPFGTATTVVSTADETLLNDTVLINDGAGTWRVRIDLSAYEGEVGLLASQMG